MPNDDEYARALRAELTKRVDEISNYDDASFGMLKAPELALVFVVGVIVPVIVVLVFR